MDIKEDQVYFTQQECIDTGLTTPLPVDTGLLFAISERIRDVRERQQGLRMDSDVIAHNEQIALFSLYCQLGRLERIQSRLGIEYQVKSFRDEIPNEINLLD